MSQRVKDLLDEAVAGIEPRNADPAATVIRRGRVARARAAVAGGLALAVVLTGGTVAAARLLPDPLPDAAATVPKEPPTPRLVDGRIVAGATSLNVPKGWRVLPAESAPCGFHARTILIGSPPVSGLPPRGCATADLLIRGTWDANPYHTAGFPESDADLTTGQRVSVVPPRMVTLRGGEPGWLQTDAVDVHRLLMPWSRVEAIMRDEEARRLVLDSVTTSRRRPAPLALPERATHADLALRTGSERPREETLADPAKVRRAVDLLRDAAVVDQRAGCAGADQPTVQLYLRTLRFANGTPSRLPPPAGGTAVVITLGDGCREAVSSDGGRVRLDAASLAELGDLFGVRLP